MLIYILFCCKKNSPILLIFIVHPFIVWRMFSISVDPPQNFLWPFHCPCRSPCLDRRFQRVMLCHLDHQSSVPCLQLALVHLGHRAPLGHRIQLGHRIPLGHRAPLDLLANRSLRHSHLLIQHLNRILLGHRVPLGHRDLLGNRSLRQYQLLIQHLNRSLPFLLLTLPVIP